jgi:hypothetical protein
MKIQTIVLITAFFYLIALNSCIFIENPCLRGSGDNTSESREVNDFTGISLNIPGKVYLTQGQVYSFSVSGYENIVKGLTTEVKNGVLEINYPTCMYNSNIVVRITMPELTQIMINGSGEVLGHGDWEVENLISEVNGSGSVNMFVIANNVNSIIVGSGIQSIQGEANKFKANITGSGIANCLQLTTARSEVSISGSGKAKVFAEENLTVNISGSGQVIFKGNPAIQKNISGSGTVSNCGC